MYEFTHSNSMHLITNPETNKPKSTNQPIVPKSYNTYKYRYVPMRTVLTFTVRGR